MAYAQLVYYKIIQDAGINFMQLFALEPAMAVIKV
jgi:hypothetical protein